MWDGRVARELADLRHRAVAVELTPSLLRAAGETGSARGYLRGDAEALPLRDELADQVVAYWAVECRCRVRALVGAELRWQWR